MLTASSAIWMGSFSAAEPKGEPCSGEAKMSETVVGARFLEVEDDLHLGALAEGLDEEFRDI